MIARLVGAVEFLTILPVHGRTASLGQSALFFPVVGAALGAAGALLLQATSRFWPMELSALVVLCFWTLITGGLHEDGLADVADAFRAGRPRDRILSIMKDSRIGAHGALALLLVTLVRWKALSAIIAEPAWALPALLAVSRSSMVVLAWLSPPAGTGLGQEFSRTLNSAVTIGVIIQALLLSFAAVSVTLLLWGTSLILAGARLYFLRRLGGVTGDCLGATCLLIETWGLLLFACQRCM